MSLSFRGCVPAGKPRDFTECHARSVHSNRRAIRRRSGCHPSLRVHLTASRYTNRFPSFFFLTDAIRRAIPSMSSRTRKEGPLVAHPSAVITPAPLRRCHRRYSSRVVCYSIVIASSSSASPSMGGASLRLAVGLRESAPTTEVLDAIHAHLRISVPDRVGEPALEPRLCPEHGRTARATPPTGSRSASRPSVCTGMPTQPNSSALACRQRFSRLGLNKLKRPVFAAGSRCSTCSVPQSSRCRTSLRWGTGLGSCTGVAGLIPVWPSQGPKGQA